MYSCESLPAKYTIASSRPLPYVDNTVRWHITNFTPDIPKHEQIGIFFDVFDHYNYELWPLRHVSTQNIREAYIRIAFVDKSGIVKDSSETSLFRCPFNFQQNKQTLAVAYPRQGRKVDGWIFVNEDYFWTVKATSGKVEIRKVLIHEIGHLFGLGHTHKKGDIMFPEYNPAYTWTQDSRNGLNELYTSQRQVAIRNIPQADAFRAAPPPKKCGIFVNRKSYR